MPNSVVILDFSQKEWGFSVLLLTLLWVLSQALVVVFPLARGGVAHQEVGPA